jgi:hypothetical protein
MPSVLKRAAISAEITIVASTAAISVGLLSWLALSGGWPRRAKPAALDQLGVLPRR